MDSHETTQRRTGHRRAHTCGGRAVAVVEPAANAAWDVCDALVDDALVDEQFRAIIEYNWPHNWPSPPDGTGHPHLHPPTVRVRVDTARLPPPGTPRPRHRGRVGPGRRVPAGTARCRQRAPPRHPLARALSTRGVCGRARGPG